MKLRFGLLVILAGAVCFCDDLSEALRSKRLRRRFGAMRNPFEDESARAIGMDRSWMYALEGLGQDRESLSSFETALRFAPDIYRR